MENQAHRYAISANGQLYPAKKIVSLATGTPVGLFSGGRPTNGYLIRHGFTIVDLPRSSEPELQFVVGQVYDRPTEIHDLFGGSRQSGISPSAKYPTIFIFTGDSGEQFGYADTHGPDGVFTYTGEGQSNDMTLTKGNLAILEHAETGRTLLAALAASCLMRKAAVDRLNPQHKADSLKRLLPAQKQIYF